MYLFIFRCSYFVSRSGAAFATYKMERNNLNKLATTVLDKCFEIHRRLGPGLLESVYEEILYYELIQAGIFTRRQVPFPLVWKGQKLDHGFRADIVVENSLIIEIKSIDALAPVHFKQVLTYLRLANIKLGLLINFNEELLKTGVKRVVNNLK